MKITKDKLQEGRNLAKKHGFKKLFLNIKGEFFTDKGLALMSVERDADKVAEVPLTAESGSTSSPTGSATTDLDKGVDVIAAVEAAETAEAVEAIKKAETEGKNRPEVIAVAEKKLETFKKAE